MQVPIGAYIPGDSAVHRLDPRAKLLVAFLLVVALFAVQSWYVIAVLCAAMVTLSLFARIPLTTFLGMLKPVFWIGLFTLVVNAFSFVGGFHFVPSGALRGLFFFIRLFVVMGTTALVTLTTSPVALTDGIALMMRPLARIKVPVEDIAMMISIGIRFIPTIAEEVDRIMLAQRARGAQFDEGSLIKRMRAWVPILVPLFVGLFRRADALARSMDARCYTGVGRTHLRELKMGATDYVVVGLSAVFLALVIGGVV